MSGLEATSEYTAHLLPALVVTAFGLGLTFVPLINAATGGAGEADGAGRPPADDVPADRRGARHRGHGH